jgi:phage terminase large subunit-like protein
VDFQSFGRHLANKYDPQPDPEQVIAANRDWRHIARPAQLPPAGEWLTWLFSGGRGTGKTRSGAEWVLDQVWQQGKKRIALVGRTPADVRDVMIGGESGIIDCSIRAGLPVPEHQPTNRVLIWPNGAKAWTYSAAASDQLRGPQHEAAWCDEIAAWDEARRGDALGTTWNNLMLGLRIGKNPQCMATTTPKRVKLLQELFKRENVAITRGTTYDNLDNLAPSFREQVLAAYEGTRIGRQELMAEMLEDIDGAIFSLDIIDQHRADLGDTELAKIVVGIDPAVTSGEESDETGIVVAGKDRDGQFWILEDLSFRGTPDQVMRRAAGAYHSWQADAVIVEDNNGGDYLPALLASVDNRVPCRSVHATRGKKVRAEPISGLYEQGRVHHIVPFPKLEDQMVSWVPDSGTSPDRMDALVWALTDLNTGNAGTAFLGWMKQTVDARREQERTAASA